ncbi:MAG: hypothetical protein ACXWUG_12685, partial [Polyangiales bacterium]
MRRKVLVILAVMPIAASACDRKPAHEESKNPAPPATTALASSTAPEVPVPAATIDGDAREAARAIFGTPPRPGRVIGTVQAATNGEPQVNAAGVLASVGAQGHVVTVYATADGLHVGGPIDLGNVRFLATDGPHVCASDRKTLHCGDVDGTDVTQRSTGATETSGLWGGPGTFVRAFSQGLETGIEASDDGFVTMRRVGIPERRLVATTLVESQSRWTSVLLPREGTGKPRYALTMDGGKTAMGDFGALDRTGWSNGDRLWPDQLVTGPFSTETVIAERGEKQSTVTLPWSAAGGFAFARRALLLFGRGASGTGGFLLVEFPSRRVTTITPAGAQPFIAAGRVGGAVVAIT